MANFWELQGGIGYQGGVFSDDHAERTYGVVGLQGVMPYGIETDVAMQVSEAGDVAASFEGEYDLRPDTAALPSAAHRNRRGRQLGRRIWRGRLLGEGIRRHR